MTEANFAVQAHAASDAISRSMWKRALRALNVGVEAAVSPQCRVPLQVRIDSLKTTVPAVGHER